MQINQFLFLPLWTKKICLISLQEIFTLFLSQVKYLGIILNKRLTWGLHLKFKRKSLNSRLHLLRPILKSKIPVQNEILIYKSMFRPIWSYGAQIWGCTKLSQVKTIEAFLSISLRVIMSAPWHVSNLTLHKILYIESVDNLVKTYYKMFHSKLFLRLNLLIANQHTVTTPDNFPRHLKRHLYRDILN